MKRCDITEIISTCTFQQPFLGTSTIIEEHNIARAFNSDKPLSTGIDVLRELTRNNFEWNKHKVTF